VGIRDRVAIVRSVTGVLVDDVNEFAFAKIAQKSFWVAPATGNGAGSLRIHVDRVVLHGNHNVSTMEGQVAGKPRPS